MSALFGYCGREIDRPADGGRLPVIAAALAGCGPDGGGSWTGGPAALGVRLLRDTPEARYERQPVASADGRWVLVADVRLDNRQQLLAQLEPGADARTIPDSALVLAAWERWGEESPRQLLGDFALAIWDGHLQRLFCVRDPMGVKPFYYHYDPQGLGFVFASQIAGLLALPEIPRRLDRIAAAAHLLVLHDDKERTLLAGLRRLPPAHGLVVGPGCPPRLYRYWKPVPARGHGAVSLDDWAEVLGAGIERAVAANARSTGGVAAHLSGGLDSSAVTCLAAREMEHAGRRFRAVSFSVPEQGDEVVTGEVVDAGYIEAVRRFSRVEVHHRRPERATFDKLLAAAAPGMMPPAYQTTSLHRWAGEQGLRILLSGLGGDEAASFNGRGLAASLVLRARWRDLAQLMRDLQRRRRIRSRRQFLIERVVAPLLPATLYPRLAGSQDSLASLLRVSPIADGLVAEADVRRRLRRRPRERPGTQGMQRRLLDNGHLVARMESWSADATRFGLDYRYPLLDRRVLELSLALPGQAFVQDGLDRWIFRRALVGRVPEEILWRPDKRDSMVQRNRQLRLEAERRRARRASQARARSVEARAWLARMLAEGNDLGGCVSLDKLRRFLEQMPIEGYSPGAVFVERAPAVAVGLLGALVRFIDHNRIDCG